MHTEVYRIGLLVPFQGPAGIFGPSCVAVAAQAKRELNQVNGIDGRAVELVFIVGGRAPDMSAKDIAQRVATNRIHALTAWQISSIRQSLLPVLSNRV